MDDMVDTAGTLVKAAQVLKDEAPTKVVAFCTHPVLSGGAVEAHRRLASRRAGGGPTPSRCARPPSARKSGSCRWLACSPKRFCDLHEESVSSFH